MGRRGVDIRVADHVIEYLVAPSEPEYDGVIVVFALAAFPIVAHPESRAAVSRSECGEGQSARLRVLLPPRQGNSSQIEDPGRRVIGAMPV